MTNKESLTDIAYAAGFRNLHDRASQCSKLIGSVMSDKFEILYFMRKEDKRKEELNFEIFGVVNPFEHDTCGLFRLNEAYLRRWIGGNGERTPGGGGINIDEQLVVSGQTAVDMLLSYAKQQ